MKKKVFALLLASLLVVSQMGVALSETEVISTPTPTLQAIIGALMGEVNEPTAEVTKAPTDENGDDEEEESTDVKDDEETGNEEEESTEENGNVKSGNEEEESTEENGNDKSGNEEEESTEENGNDESGDEEEESTEDEVAPTDFSVTIEIVNLKDIYYVGDILRMESNITGICNSPAYQWQVDVGDGVWTDVEGATDWYYEYALYESNFEYSYRVVVTDMAPTFAVEPDVEEETPEA